MADARPDGFDRRAAERVPSEYTRYLDQVYHLTRANDRHDVDTGAHIQRIRHLVACIAQRLGFDAEDAQHIGLDAMLHDVGKLNVSPDLLGKQGELTETERAEMEAHTVHGFRMLSDEPNLERAARIARSHHEAWDGTGYPDGLVGDAIPLEARMTAAADIFEALTAARAYKQSWPYEQALDELRRLSGTRLDPAVVEAILACDAAGELRPIIESTFT